MKISEYLKVECVCSELDATTKEGAITELASLVKDRPEINDFDQFVFLTLPIWVQEMVFALWLIVKGFNLSAIASESVLD